LRPRRRRNSGSPAGSAVDDTRPGREKRCSANGSSSSRVDTTAALCSDFPQIRTTTLNPGRPSACHASKGARCGSASGPEYPVRCRRGSSASGCDIPGVQQRGSSRDRDGSSVFAGHPGTPGLSSYALAGFAPIPASSVRNGTEADQRRQIQDERQRHHVELSLWGVIVLDPERRTRSRIESRGSPG
jgi:hypothetical protein